MLKYLLSVLLINLLTSCSGQKCTEIPNSFNTYADAKQIITSYKFIFKDNANTSKSSWIRSAEYFSCDNKFGYLLFKTDRQEYIHQNVPIEIWKSFKQAASFGEYYNRNIKNRYRLELRQ